MYIYKQMKKMLVREASGINKILTVVLFSGINFHIFLSEFSKMSNCL